jgi:hypothetical protein
MCVIFAYNTTSHTQLADGGAGCGRALRKMLSAAEVRPRGAVMDDLAAWLLTSRYWN